MKEVKLPYIYAKEPYTYIYIYAREPYTNMQRKISSVLMKGVRLLCIYV